MNTLNYLLSATAVTKDVVFDTVAEALSYGLPKALFGFLTVFFVLVIIWGILGLFRIVFSGFSKDETVKAKKQEKAVVKEIKESAPQVTSNTIQTTDDREIVAAISAAISAYRGQANNECGFRVVSFKKRI